MRSHGKARNRSGCTGGTLALALLLLPAARATAAAGDPMQAPASPDQADAPAAVAATLGEPVKLLASGRLGLRFFPDTPVTVLSPPPQLRVLIAAEVSTWLVEGKGFDKLGRARKVLEPGKPGAFDNGYAGVAGAVEVDGVLYAAYHAEDQEGLPMLSGGVPGFHASVGMASSDDGGRTFTVRGPVVTSARPKGWRFYPGQADSGAGEPWLIRSHDGAWWYLYYTEHSREGGRGVQICMARAPASAPPEPGAFRKYHRGEFGEPGLGGLDTPVVSGIAFDQGEAFGPQVVYAEELKLYVMVLNLNVWKEFVEKKGLARSGMYLATSADGVRWSRPEPLLVDWVIPLDGRSLTWHPALVLDPGSSTDGWLLYAHTAAWNPQSGTPHHLWGRRIQLRPRG